MQFRFALSSYNEERDIQNTGSTTERHEEDDVDTLSLGLDWQKALGTEHLLTWGLDVSNDDVDSYRNDTNLDTGAVTPRPGAFAPDSRYTTLGLFAQDEVLAFDPYFLTLGARYSFYDFSFLDSASDTGVDGSFDAFVMSAEAARDVDEGVTLTATIAQGFRAPSLEDLANTSSFAGGTEIGNPNLQPEKSLTGEVGAAVRKPMWGGTLAGFYTHIDDLIGRSLLDEGDPTTTGDETYLRDNTGEAAIYGLEAALDLKLVDPASPYSFVTNLAWVIGREYGETTDPLTGEVSDYSVPYRRIPPLNGRVGFRYQGAYTRNHLDWAELYMLWASSQDALHPFDETDPRIDPQGTPGWTTLNLDLGGVITERVDWTLGFHNIFDKSYRVHTSGIDAPGAAVVIGLHANF
jgi:outer membrane receptor protein involved in Fe transport